MNSEKNMSSRALIGHSSLQLGDDEPQVFAVYQLRPELPEQDKKRQVCFEHIRQGLAAQLMHNFDMVGAHFPEKDEPQEMTTQLSCKGVSCILKKCGLKIEQFDPTGEKIGEMKLQ